MQSSIFSIGGTGLLGAVVMFLIVQFFNYLKAGKLDKVLPSWIVRALKRYGLDDFARVEEAIAYAAKWHGLSDDERRAIAAHYLKSIIAKELQIVVPDRFINLAIEYVYNLVYRRGASAKPRNVMLGDYISPTIKNEVMMK